MSRKNVLMPVTISAVVCRDCGVIVNAWEEDETTDGSVFLAVFTCPMCDAQTAAVIAWDDLDSDDRPLVEVVR